MFRTDDVVNALSGDRQIAVLAGYHTRESDYSQIHRKLQDSSCYDGNGQSWR